MNNEKIITFEIPKGYVLKESHPDKLVYEKIDQPTSLAEAGDILNLANPYAYRYEQLEALQKLLVIRDAWWKMADDWEPDWNDDLGLHYTIIFNGAYTNKINETNSYSLLAFPTAEMRDTFYENFKDLIEICKDLL